MFYNPSHICQKRNFGWLSAQTNTIFATGCWQQFAASLDLMVKMLLEVLTSIWNWIVLLETHFTKFDFFKTTLPKWQEVRSLNLHCQESPSLMHSITVSFISTEQSLAPHYTNINGFCYMWTDYDTVKPFSDLSTEPGSLFPVFMLTPCSSIFSVFFDLTLRNRLNKCSNNLFKNRLCYYLSLSLASFRRLLTFLCVSLCVIQGAHESAACVFWDWVHKPIIIKFHPCRPGPSTLSGRSWWLSSGMNCGSSDGEATDCFTGSGSSAESFRYYKYFLFLTYGCCCL